jgi:hypothetical protein
MFERTSMEPMRYWRHAKVRYAEWTAGAAMAGYQVSLPLQDISSAVHVDRLNGLELENYKK